jgi:FHS family glucose/mannose:H+ symporter-like MFS transporter
MDADRKYRLALLITGCAAFTMMGAGLSLYGPAVLSYQALFSLTSEKASWVLSAHWAGSLSAVLVMFLFPGRIGPRPGLFFLAAGAGLLGAGISWAVTLIGAVVLGLGYGSLIAVFNPRILVAFGPRGPAMLSLINAVFSLGAILAPLAFSLATSNPERLFMILGAMTALIFLTAGPASRGEAQTASKGGGFKVRPLILIFGAFGIGLEASLVGLGPLALVRSGVSEASAAQLLSAFFLTFLFGRIGLIFLADRLPSFALFLMGMILTSAGLWGCALFSPEWAFPLIGFAAGMFFPGYYVTGTAQMGDDPRVSPFLIGMAQIGAMVLPLILALSIDPFGPRGFFWVTAALTLVLSALSALSYRRLIRPAQLS